MRDWVIDPKKTTPLWLEVRYKDVTGGDDSPDSPPWFAAYVKWDGCLEIWEWEPRSRIEHAALHVCDLDEHIEMWMKLRDIAQVHFGKEWPNV